MKDNKRSFYKDKPRKGSGHTDAIDSRAGRNRRNESGNNFVRGNEKSGETRNRIAKGKDSKVARSTSYKEYSERPIKAEDAEYMNEGIDKLEGRNSVLEAIKSNRTINKMLVSKGDKEGSIKQIIALAREKGIIVQETDRTSIDKISTTHAHQGVIAFVSVKDYVEVEDILESAKAKGEAPFIILLDGITDPHNLGSILRTANAVGAHGVVIPKRRAIGLTAAVSKASAGAIEYVPVARVTNLSQTIEYLKEQSLWVVGTDQTGEKSFYDIDMKGPIALVIGSEGEGMGKLVSEKCDFVVNLPMKGQISSLNAAVAGAIVMYEILKQRS
jgi:23S rRNA (guanosine2251-2'-O)-methyltransferase